MVSETLCYLCHQIEHPKINILKRRRKMPLIKPKPEETEQEWIDRCMSNEVMNREYPDNKVRAGICYSQWRTSKNLKKDSKKRVIL